MLTHFKTITTQAPDHRHIACELVNLNSTIMDYIVLYTKQIKTQR